MKYSLLLSVIPSMLTAATCNLPIDLVFLQDTTASFDDDIPNITAQLPNIIRQLTEQNPGSRFGVAEFRDKPYFPLGYPDDFCYRLNRGGSLTDDIKIFYEAYSTLVADGGADLPEAQFQALINAVLDPRVGWKDLTADGGVNKSRIAARIIVLVTDAVPHIAGDVARMTNLTGLPANSGSISGENIDDDCTGRDYPTPAQVAEVLIAHKLHLLIMAPAFAGVERAWRWFSETLLRQKSAYFQITESDSSDFAPALQRGLAAILEDVDCQPDSYTTAAVLTNATQDCGGCPCDHNAASCDGCDVACQGAVNIRLAKKPQHLQLVVDNE